MKNGKIISICEQKLKFLNYSPHTIKCYIHHISSFLNRQQKQATHLNALDFTKYIESYEFSSVSQQNQVINAIRFLYKCGLNRKYNKVSFERPRQEKRLPQALDMDFLISRISRIANLKHRAILSLASSVGLRVSEVVNLKIEDIDSDQMVLRIKQAKGKKDRNVPLTKNLLVLLRRYFLKYKPDEYLFNGQKALKYSATSCNKLVKKYIGEKYHFHQIRHSVAINLLNKGVDVSYIKDLLGHTDIKTTLVYLKLTVKDLQKLPLAI